MFDQIKESFARAHFVDEWAKDQDEKDWPAGRPSGQQLMDMAPETPEEYSRGAIRFFELFIKDNCPAPVDQLRLEQLYKRFEQEAETEDSARQQETPMDPDRFGHYLYMESVGHGVGLWEWVDDHGLKIHEAQPIL